MDSDGLARNSARICGIRIQGLPDAERPGIANSAKLVGFNGAKTDQSWPASSEKFFQSKRPKARRSRMRSMLIPFPKVAFPPKKSTSAWPLMRAPPTVGPW